MNRITPLVIAASLFSGQALAIPPDSERDALLALYEATEGHNWSNNTGWGEGENACNYYGVTCSDGGANVIGLSLPDNNLNGPIPDELVALPQLQELDLSGNAINGVLPRNIGDFSSLFALDLAGNRIKGPIPKSFEDLPLEGLDISYNALFLAPPVDASLLEYLDLTQPGWADTQTIPPVGLTTVADGNIAGNVIISWDPVSYQADPGGYDIFRGNAPAGPYTEIAQVMGKDRSSLSVPQGPGPASFFAIRTVTSPHAANMGIVHSILSDDASDLCPRPYQTVRMSGTGGIQLGDGSPGESQFFNLCFDPTNNCYYGLGQGGVNEEFAMVMSEDPETGDQAWTADTGECAGGLGNYDFGTLNVTSDGDSGGRLNCLNMPGGTEGCLVDDEPPDDGVFDSVRVTKAGNPDIMTDIPYYPDEENCTHLKIGQMPLSFGTSESSEVQPVDVFLPVDSDCSLIIGKGADEVVGDLAPSGGGMKMLPPLRGDLDGDGDVDRDDMQIIRTARNQDANANNDPRDINQDGRITARDIRAMLPLCTLPRCANP